MTTNLNKSKRLLMQESFDRKAHDISAQENMGDMWVDSFSTNAGISTSGANTTSANYTYRGASNYDVIKTTGGVETEGQNYKTGQNDYYHIHYDNSYYRAGQQITTGSSEAGTVTKISLYLQKWGSPSGNIWAELWSDDGSDGPNAILTNGKSANVSIASLGTSFGWIDFTWVSGPTIAGSTKYWIVLDSDIANSDTTNARWGYAYTGGTYAGGGSRRGTSTGWLGYGAECDCLFDLYYLPVVGDCYVYTITNTSSTNKSSLLVMWEESLGTGTITVSGSCNGGTNWTEVGSPSSYTSPAGTTKYKYMTGLTAGNDIRIKVVITGNAALKAWGVSW